MQLTSALTSGAVLGLTLVGLWLLRWATQRRQAPMTWRLGGLRRAVAQHSDDVPRIRVLDVKWFSPQAGCAVIELPQGRFLLPLGQCGTPRALHVRLRPAGDPHDAE